MGTINQEFVKHGLRKLFVRYALRIGALELITEGRTLKNGRISPYFFNSGLFKTGRDLTELATAYTKNIYSGPDMPDLLFGPAYKGIPLVCAIATTLGDDIEFAFNRKEAKDHGECGLIVGASLKGKKVLIVDDVITDGGTKRETVELVREHGGTPIKLVIAFDRQERGSRGFSAVQEFERYYGIPVEAAATLHDLISVLRDMRHPMLDAVLKYQEQYGIN